MVMVFAHISRRECLGLYVSYPLVRAEAWGIRASHWVLVTMLPSTAAKKWRICDRNAGADYCCAATERKLQAPQFPQDVDRLRAAILTGGSRFFAIPSRHTYSGRGATSRPLHPRCSLQASATPTDTSVPSRGAWQARERRARTSWPSASTAAVPISHTRACA